MSVNRPVILCLSEDVSDAGIFRDPPWGPRWTLVTKDRPEDAARRLGEHLRLGPGMGVPEISGRGIALWVVELEQLEAALADENWLGILFAPGASAVLDALRLQRQILVASGDLERGRVLTTDDLEPVKGAHGIPVTLLDAMMGQTLCYNLAKGEPLTFGMIIPAESAAELIPDVG